MTNNEPPNHGKRTVQPKKKKNPAGHKSVTSCNNITSQSQQDQNKPPDVIVIGGSITKNIIGKKLSRNQTVNAFSFLGATIDDMVDFAKPILLSSGNRRKLFYMWVPTI